MLNRTLALGLAAAVLMSCSGESADDSAPAVDAASAAAAADQQALDDFRGYWEEHYNLGHASMVAATYHEESWSLPASGGILMGRAAIEADLETSVANSPTASITGLENMVFGDQAVTMGTYTVQSVGADGEAMEFDGTYMNLMTRVDGGWQIQGSAVNYGEARPDGWPWNDAGEPPPDEGTMGEFVDYFATHWNMGHASMVADTYTENAVVSYSNGPVMRGRAAVSAEIEARMAAGGTAITIHDVGTIELGEGWALDGGWYQVNGPDDGDLVQTGAYLHLMQQQEDGSWMTHWAVTNAQPPAGM